MQEEADFLMDTLENKQHHGNEKPSPPTYSFAHRIHKVLRRERFLSVPFTAVYLAPGTVPSS